MKRTFDIVIGVALAIATSPILAVAAAAVFVADGQPVIYRQLRVGRWGRTFTLLKFRSMRSTSSAHQLTVDADPRITRVGSVLRSTRIDELPQLFNVLRGDMSLVGYRPEVPDYVARQADRYEPLLRYRPGLTDPATLAYANESALLAAVDEPERYYIDAVLPCKIELSLAYARKATVVSDIVVLLRTARIVSRSEHR